MQEDKPKKKTGRPKIPTVSEMITEGPAAKPQKTSGGARPGAGAPRLYKRLDVTQRLDELGFNPIDELVKIFLSTADEKLKVNISQDLLSYVAPRQKAETITHKVEGDGMAEIMALVQATGRPKPPTDK